MDDIIKTIVTDAEGDDIVTVDDGDDIVTVDDVGDIVTNADDDDIETIIMDASQSEETTHSTVLLDVNKQQNRCVRFTQFGGPSRSGGSTNIGIATIYSAPSLWFIKKCCSPIPGNHFFTNFKNCWSRSISCC